MNILQIQDDLKNFSEQQLINEMQRPSGNAPQYLVLSEINRRKRVKSDFEANKAADTNTVAEEAVASAGVPAEGMRGMAEAMAPRSESSLVAQPQGMRTGGLMNFGREINREISEDVNPFLDEVADMAENRFNIKLDSMENQFAQMRPAIDEAPDYMPRPAVMDRMQREPMTPFARLGGISRLSGLGGKGRSDVRAFNQGGIINAFSGKYFDSTGRPTNELLNAMILQESGGNPRAIGGVGERGLGQIRPTTAIMPGYGVQSLFPELANQIGKGKKYATAQDAYLDNKEKSKEWEKLKAEKEKKKAKFKHIGTVGEKEILEVKLVDAKFIDNEWGGTTLFIMATKDDQVIKSFSNSSIFNYFLNDKKELVENKFLKFNAVIKKHSEFDGIKETLIKVSSRKPI